MKLYTILYLTCFFLLGSLAVAQPKLEVKEGLLLDFGDVISGQKISHEVTLKNTGTQTLHISNVRAQCGCTATLLKEKTLDPGQEAALSITFNSTGYGAGKVQKHVYIDTDDPKTPETTIEFDPNVVRLLDVNPNMFSFNTKIDSEITRSVIIKNLSKDSINILSMDNSYEYLHLSLSKKNLAPGDSTILTGVLNTPKSGSDSPTVTLLTDHPNLPKLEIKAFMWVNRK